MKRLSALILFTSIILISCGKSIDKNSLEGRTASFISDYAGVNLAMSFDVNKILDKSGIRDGAIPAQCLETIQPFIDALQESVNLEKQVFFIPFIDFSDADNSGGLILFDVKDLDRLKKEFKEMGFNLTKKDHTEFGISGPESAGIFKEQTGFIVFMDSGSNMNESVIKNIAQSLDAGKTVDGVVDFVNMNSDMAMFYTGDKTQVIEKTGVAELDALSAKMSDLTRGTYWIGEMVFKDQEAVMTVDITFGKNMKQYLPLLSEGLSKEAQAVLVNESAFAAFAVSAHFEKIVDMLVSNLDAQARESLDKNMSMLGGLEKFREMFSGELSFSMAPGDEMPIISGFMGINDKKQLKSLLDGFGFFLGLKKNGDGYKMDDNFLQFSEKGLLFAMNQQNLKDMQNGKMLKTRKLGGFQFGAAPVSLFLDMKQMTKISGMEEFADVIQNFDYLTFEMSNNQGKMIIKSTKNNQNILRTLVEGFIEMQRLDQIRQEEIQREYEAAWDDEDWGEDFTL